jgi:periplasmic divalent cation tolerance protein
MRYARSSSLHQIQTGWWNSPASSCASGHNFQPIRTIYRWQGQVHDETEGRVALRTRRSLLPQIIDRVKREHPYEVPSIVAVPIIDGGPDYIAWILEQTEDSA